MATTLGIFGVSFFWGILGLSCFLNLRDHSQKKSSCEGSARLNFWKRLARSCGNFKFKKQKVGENNKGQHNLQIREECEDLGNDNGSRSRKDSQKSERSSMKTKKIRKKGRRERLRLFRAWLFKQKNLENSVEKDNKSETVRVGQKQWQSSERQEGNIIPYKPILAELELSEESFLSEISDQQDQTQNNEIKSYNPFMSRNAEK